MGNTMAARVLNPPLVCVPIDTLQGTISDASKAQSIQSKLNIQTLFRRTHVVSIAHIPRARSASPHAKPGDRSDASGTIASFATRWWHRTNAPLARIFDTANPLPFHGDKASVHANPRFLLGM